MILPKADVLIFSPLSLNDQFRKSYGDQGIYYLPYQDMALNNKIYFIISMAVRILRVHGYYHKNSKDMQYYLKNRYKKIGDNGYDIEVGFINKFFINIVGLIGTNRKAWKIFEFILFKLDKKNTSQLIEFTRKYIDVTLIQASTWGNQDRLLAFVAKKKFWRTVFLPYTTDQLFSNGYLYSDYDSICIKGVQEREHIFNFHKYVDPKKLLVVGNLQYRIYDEILKINQNIRLNKNKNYLTIMFAGTTSTNVPTKSEQEALDFILSQRKLDTKIIYRAFMQSDEHKNTLENKYKDNDNFEIQYVSENLTGLHRFEGKITCEILKNYLESLDKADILVTVGPTSLTLDAAYLGIPTISYWGDKTGVLENRFTHLLFEENKINLKNIFSEVPTAHTCDQLIEKINILSENRKLRKSYAEKIIAKWDSVDVDFRREFKSAIFNEIN
jgi:hypothetical protein